MQWLLNNLGLDSPLERLLVIAQLVDAIQYMFKVFANLIVLLAVLAVVHFEHFLIIGPVVWLIAERIIAQG